MFSRTILLRAGRKHYPFSKKYFENYIRRLNSKNITVQNDAILNNEQIIEIEEKEHTNEYKTVEKSKVYTVDDISTFYRNQYTNQTGNERFQNFEQYKNELERNYPELFNYTFHAQPLVISKEVESELDKQIDEIERKQEEERKFLKEQEDEYSNEYSLENQEEEDDVSIPEAFYQKSKQKNDNNNYDYYHYHYDYCY